MARMTFSPDNVKKNPFSFPKLKGEKKGDKFRIVLLEDPEFGYVHELRKPLIEDGVPVIETKTAFKSQKQYEANVMKWVSSPKCTGNVSVLDENGSDPANCLMCKEAKDSDRVKPPKRKFALHVFVYDTKQGTTSVSEIYGGRVVIWTFTDQVYEKLVGYLEEYEDLRQHDLLLTVDRPDFNGFDISISQKAMWLRDEETKAKTKAIFKENHAEDLGIFVGMEKEEKYIEMDLEDIRAAWRVANGHSADADADKSSLVGARSLDEGIDDLLDNDSKVSDEDNEDEGLVSSVSPDDDDTEDPNPASKDEEAEEAEEDFDDLLKGL